MENTLNKKVLIGFGVAVAVIVLGSIAVLMYNKFAVTAEPVATTPAEEEIVVTNTPSLAEQAVAKKARINFGSQPVTLNYEKALELYPGALRIQISGEPCQANPNNVMYKNGTTIMIDNRSAQSRTIKLGSTYTIGGYDFKIITLSSATLPTTLVMDCGQQQNIAKVLLQK